MGWIKLPIYLMLVYAVDSFLFYPGELKKFADFLFASSQYYSQINNRDVTGGSWESSNRFQGDIILDDGQRDIIKENLQPGSYGTARNAIRNVSMAWPEGEVPYEITLNHFNYAEQKVIENAMNAISSVSCIKFRKATKYEKDQALIIQSNQQGCFANVGYNIRRKTLMNLNRSGCLSHGTIIHELLHVLGLWHMHSDPNRDEFIHIVKKNIIPKFMHQFRIILTTDAWDYDFDYDYESIMHYPPTAFSKNNRNTIEPTKEGVKLVKRERLSKTDVKKLNRLYSCQKQSARSRVSEDIGNKGGAKLLKFLKLVLNAEAYLVEGAPVSDVLNYNKKVVNESYSGKELLQTQEGTDPNQITEYPPTTESTLSDDELVYGVEYTYSGDEKYKIDM